MGFLFTDIPALIPLVARASALDDASDSDLASSALISFSSHDWFDSRFADVRLSRNRDRPMDMSGGSDLGKR